MNSTFLFTKICVLFEFFLILYEAIIEKLLVFSNNQLSYSKPNIIMNGLKLVEMNSFKVSTLSHLP